MQDTNKIQIQIFFVIIFIYFQTFPNMCRILIDRFFKEQVCLRLPFTFTFHFGWSSTCLRNDLTMWLECLDPRTKSLQHLFSAAIVSVECSKGFASWNPLSKVNKVKEKQPYPIKTTPDLCEVIIGGMVLKALPVALYPFFRWSFLAPWKAI